MRETAQWRAALAMAAALSGVGLATGREVALFLGQTGGTAWVGVAVASALFGLLVAGGARLPAADRHEPLARACGTLRLVLAGLMAWLMLHRLGRVGELTLPLRHGYAFGIGFGALAALAMDRLSARGHGRLGLAVTLYAGLFLAANALDPRPARLHLIGAVDYAYEGSAWAAALLAAPYAAMVSAPALWRLRDLGPGVAARPARLGVKAAAILALLLAAAVAALLRGGDGVLVQPMPWVVLSARWGLWGFWVCAGLQGLCSAATLSAAFGMARRCWQSKKSSRFR